MIDTDSSGLIGPDEYEGLCGHGRQDLWLAGCCQMKRCLKPAKTCLFWIPTHMHTQHLSASMNPVHPASLVVFDHPQQCPSAFCHSSHIATLGLHTLRTNASACPRASQTNGGCKTQSSAHTLISSLCFTKSPQKSLHPFLFLSIVAKAQVVHATWHLLPIIQSIAASLQWLYYRSRQHQDCSVRQKEDRLILNSTQIRFPSKKSATDFQAAFSKGGRKLQKFALKSKT